MNRCYISFFPFLGQTGCLEQQTGCFEQVHKRHPSYVFLLCKQPGYNEPPIPCFYRKGLGVQGKILWAYQYKIQIVKENAYQAL